MENKKIIFEYSMQLTGNRWDAEDLTQEAWLKVANVMSKDPQKSITNAYLYRVVRNTWIDEQRKRRIHTVTMDPSHEPSMPDDLLSTRELLELLAERLPPKMAVILLLMDVLDFTAKETSEYVQQKEATVQVTLGRARTKLRKLAQIADLERQVKSPRHESDQVDLDALVDAFRRRNPQHIYQAYMNMVEQGVTLTQLRTTSVGLHFTFRDPDGNYFNIVTK